MAEMDPIVGVVVETAVEVLRNELRDLVMAVASAPVPLPPNSWVTVGVPGRRVLAVAVREWNGRGQVMLTTGRWMDLDESLAPPPPPPPPRSPGVPVTAHEDRAHSLVPGRGQVPV